MRTAPSPLDTNLALEETSLSWLLEITRTDGEVVRLTMVNADVTYSSQTWASDPGFDITSLTVSGDGTPAALDIAIPIDTATPVTFDDVQDGLYSGAEGQLYILDYNSPSVAMAVIPIVVGSVRFSDAKSAAIEFVGKLDTTRNIRIPTLQTPCPNQLGDSRCNVPIRPADVARSTAYAVGDYVRAPDGSDYHNRNFKCTTAGTTAGTAPSYDYTVGNTTTDGTAVFTAEQAWTRSGEVTSVINNGSFVANVEESRAVDDWFTEGVLRFTSGENADLPGIPVRGWVRTVSPAGTIVLWFDAPRTVAIGDDFEIHPGCDKSTGARGCEKFDNLINAIKGGHNGFPFLPGDDFAYGPYERPPPPPPPPPEEPYTPSVLAA